MTKEELEKEAKEFVSKIASGTPQEMDYYANILVEFANETTKELENKVAILTNENKILKQGKTNVFAELNEETAESNAMLMDKVADLEKENAELKKSNGELAGQKASLERWLGEAKAIIKDIISSYGSTEVSEAQLYLKMKRAEKFLEE